MNKLWVLQRDEVMGMDIGTKKQYVVQGWEFILSKIDSRNWAFGIVPISLKWAIITWDFLAYDINTELVDMDFFLAFISLNNFEKICAQASSGTTNRQRLSEPKFLNFEIQIPETIWEQKEMMKKYFEYKKWFSELKNISDRNEKLIKSLRSSILQDAIQWKLVPQDPNDESASVLIKKIQAEKIKLIAEWKIKKQNPLPPTDSKENSYELPKEWKWVRLEDVCLSITDGTHQTPNYTETGAIFLSAQNIKPFQFIPNHHRYVSQIDYEMYNKNVKPEFEDVLVTRVGSNIGESAVIDKKLDFAIYVSLCLIKSPKDLLSPYYLCLWLNSPDGTYKSISNILGKWHSQWNLNLWLIRNFQFPLPPYNEQLRIVEKVTELIKSCEFLDEQVKQAKERSENLMESVLQGVFNW